MKAESQSKDFSKDISIVLRGSYGKIVGVAKIRMCKIDYGIIDDRQLIESVRVYGGEGSYEELNEEGIWQTDGYGKSSRQIKSSRVLKSVVDARKGKSTEKARYISIYSTKNSEMLIFYDTSDYEKWIERLSKVPVVHKTLKKKYVRKKKLEEEGDYVSYEVEDETRGAKFVLKFSKTGALLDDYVDVLVRSNHLDVQLFHELHEDDDLVQYILLYPIPAGLLRVDRWYFSATLNKKLQVSLIYSFFNNLLLLVFKLARSRILHRHLIPSCILVSSSSVTHDAPLQVSLASSHHSKYYPTLAINLFNDLLLTDLYCCGLLFYDL